MSISNYLLSELNVKIPVTLIDPTTNHIFLEPITLQTGETFDRSTLQKTQWINPETNELIDQSTTFLNLKIQQQVTQFLINEANQFFKNLIKKNVNEQIDSIISFVSFLPHETNITIKQESQTLMGNFLEKQMNGIGSKTFNDSLSNLNDKKKYKLILYLLHSDLPKIVISLFENAPEFLKVFPVDNPQLMTKLKLVNDFNPDLIDRFIQVLVSQKSYYQVEQYFDYGIPIEKADEYYEGMIDQFNENRDITPSFCEHFVNVIYNHLFLSTRDEDELLLCANILLKKCVPIILNQKNLIQTEEQKIRAILHKIALIFACFPTISKITSDIFSKELLFVSCFSQVNVDTKIAHSGRKLISILLQRFYYVDDGRIHFGNVENKISRMISYSVQLPFILLAQINQQFTENDVSKHLSVLSEAMKSRLLWETKLSIIEKFVDEYSNRKNIKIPLAEELLSELFRAIRMFPLNTLPSVLSTIEIISRGSDNKPKIADQKGIQIILEAMKMNQQNPQIQSFAIHTLWEISQYSTENRQIIANLNGILLILNTMENFRKNSFLQTYSCAALWVLEVTEHNRNIIVEHNGIQSILESMKFHPKNGELQANACGSLWNLAVNEENKRIIAQNQGIKLILNSMINHKNNEKVLKYACGALANIASIEENIEQLKNQQLKEILDFIFQNYSNEPSIIKQATRLSTRIN